jgi:hypothetical protein
MSIDTTFQPKTLTTLVGVTATQIGGTSAAGGTGQQLGVTSFRIKNILATAQVIGWGQSAASAVATPAAANAPQNALTVPAGAPAMYLELPWGTFFIANIAAAFEVTGGQGGVGG